MHNLEGVVVVATVGHQAAAPSSTLHSHDHFYSSIVVVCFMAPCIKYVNYWHDDDADHGEKDSPSKSLEIIAIEGFCTDPISIAAKFKAFTAKIHVIDGRPANENFPRANRVHVDINLSISSTVGHYIAIYKLNSSERTRN